MSQELAFNHFHKNIMMLQKHQNTPNHTKPHQIDFCYWMALYNVTFGLPSRILWRCIGHYNHPSMQR